MESLQTIFILLFAAVLLVGIAQKIHIAYPIALVLGGAFIGFIPGLPAISFEPDLILLIVLPPILYYASFGISFRGFQKNWKDIFSLALGLVVFTTLVVGIIFKWMFPEFSWALAFAFGAIVSPPDAIATTTILKRFNINSHLVSLLEGESLINDASAIVLYKLSVTAILSGTFSLLEGGQRFIQVVFGGVVLGLVLGFLIQLFAKRYLQPVLGVVFSFTIPYISYILATLMGFSGVLTVVVNGLIGSRILLLHPSSLRRVLGYAAWDIFIILLNCFVFILIGLQLKAITSTMTLKQMTLYSGYAFLITFAMIVIRMVWVYARVGISYIRATNHSKSFKFNTQTLHDAALIGWAGMRGIVSLAVAIALPLTSADGFPLEGRNEVIFITFIVIMITLLIPGLSLPLLISWLKIENSAKKCDEQKIRGQLIKIAKKKLRYFLDSKKITAKEYHVLRTYFISQHRILELSHTEKKMHNSELVRIKVFQAQRKMLLEMWKRHEISDELLTHLEGELDIGEVHIARAELK